MYFTTEHTRRRKVISKVLRGKGSSKKDILKLDKPKVVDYPKEGELAQRITDLIDEYAGELSTVSVIGILTLAIVEVREALEQ